MGDGFLDRQTNGCPVSGNYFGRIWGVSDNMIILTEADEMVS